MVDINYYDIKTLSEKIRLFLEESYLIFYLNECYELEPIRESTKQVHITLDTKYEK